MLRRPALLVIDDDKIYHFLISRILDGVAEDVENLNIQKYFSGKDAIAFFKDATESHSKVVVLLDLNMPIMTGFDFLDELASFSLPEDFVSVYIVTSSVNKADKDKAAEFPVVKDFLVKPVNPKTIRKLIQDEFSWWWGTSSFRPIPNKR